METGGGRRARVGGRRKSDREGERGGRTGEGGREGGKEGIMRECGTDRSGRKDGGRADADNTDWGQLSVANDRKVESMREFEVSKHGARQRTRRYIGRRRG